MCTALPFVGCTILTGPWDIVPREELIFTLASESSCGHFPDLIVP
jgi:hypothetical protein